MARQTLVLIPALVSLALAGAALAAQAPVAVSPGATSKVALIGDGCPTFSWGEVEGAKSYELVVYRVGDGADSEPVLGETFAGSVYGWTPSLDRCLERGGQYAWSVRAVGGHDAPGWSAPNLFEVAARPSEAEFEEAVAVVRQYLEQEDTRSTKASRDNAEPSPERGSSTLGMPVAGVDSSSRLSVGTGDSALQVNGSPVVTEATLEAGCLGRRWLDQGDGTVLDCNTRLIWLKDASCLGTGTWGLSSTAGTAQKKVADLNDGSTSFACGDYVQGTHTDWRVPKIEELCSAGEISQPCPVANYATSLVDGRFPYDGVSFSPKVSNADGDGRWVEGDPFVGFYAGGGGYYWSATERITGSTAWNVILLNGAVGVAPVGVTMHVMPVRDGQ